MTPTEPRILIVGPGALGCLFAARLGRRWPGLYVLDRREERAVRLQEDGFHVTGATLADWTPPPGRVRARVERGGGARSWPVMDAVFLFVKAHALEAALKAAAPAIGPKTALVIFPEAADLSKIKGAGRRVVAAMTEDRARVEGVGRVVHEAAGDVFLDAAAGPARMTADILKGASIHVFLDKKTREKRWEALLAQVCVDVPAALADVQQKRVVEPPLAPLAEGLLLECAAVSRAAKRPVSPALLRRRRDALIMNAPASKSPLGLDLLRGRPTERALLLDPLLAVARKGKVKTPLLSAMDRLLRRLEKEGASS